MGPKMDLKMVPKCVTVVTFGGSEVPKNEPEKMKKERPGAGPILLPSVAPEGTPPAMLLKKLAFGKRPLKGRPLASGRRRAVPV